MKTISYKLLKKDLPDILNIRESIKLNSKFKVVKPILDDIKANGDDSVIKYAKKYDGFVGKNLKVGKKELINASKIVSPEFKKAIKIAAENIKNFHLKQIPKNYSVQTMPGIKCSREYRAIENVGLYIPGGTAILPSTLLMLAIPAKIAGCKRIVVCCPTNKNLSAEVLYVAQYLGLDEIYKVGGAQAIGLMAFGTKKVKKVDKIFGPGNQFVTAAKALVSIDPSGCSIDMIAGPSEVMVIADDSADPGFIAADLLSQAEHGNDSQVILCTNSKQLISEVIYSIDFQTKKLERKEYIKNSLKKSYSIIFRKIDDAIKFSNNYAPEHLIINTRNALVLSKKVTNAGSVFIGGYSPESVGDYASGTNHSLPTSGYAKSIGGVSVEMFMKGISFQHLTKKGLRNISETVVTLAETEKLQAHANAVKIRFKK